jgi:hypothetical protein
MADERKLLEEIKETLSGELKAAKILHEEELA